MTRWGIVTTTNAEQQKVLEFAAWHLELGADRLFIYLDAPDPETQGVLNAHPKIRAIHTDAAWWEKRNRRPVKHQVRQCANARHANNQKPDVDWLAHIDVDEFLIPDQTVAEVLANLPKDAFCARVRPIEALAPAERDPENPRYFKTFHLDPKLRQAATDRSFPKWSEHLSGGFLSHVAGKLFFRTGHKGLDIKIHNVIRDDVQNPGMVELSQITLAHFHADSWDHFIQAYRFRLERGSYRADLKPQVKRDRSMSLHDLFQTIEADGGEAALRQFYEDVATATPSLRAALDKEGLLRQIDFQPKALLSKHFKL